MILTIAKGSRGHYYVGEDGLVYTCHQFDTRGLAKGMGPEPGERPDPAKYPQFAHTTPFWLPTGEEEPLEGEQAQILEEAREELDVRWMKVEAREQIVCPECGKAAVRDHRLLVHWHVPFVCEERHITIDESEPADPPGKDAPAARPEAIIQQAWVRL